MVDEKLVIDGEEDTVTVTFGGLERLFKLMGENRISGVEIGELKVTRDPKAEYYGALGKQAAAIAQPAGAKEPTDEELLLNPMAGLEDLENG